MFASMRWDYWELLGLAGEFLFFSRLLAQWLASEKSGRPRIPRVYWHLSLAGALILAVYALHLGSFAVLLPQLFGLLFYWRGLRLDQAERREKARRQRLGLDRPDYPWPSLSVIVPVHNEEAALAKTLESILAQAGPGEEFEVVVGLNGCQDNSREVATRYPVRLVEDPRSGIGFGKNLGAGMAKGEELVFVDADTILPPGSLRQLREAVAGVPHYVGTVPGWPDRGGGVVKLCFLLANFITHRRRCHSPGGVIVIDRETFQAINGFDEVLPTSTSTDLIWRGLKTGAEYVYINSFTAVTSIRRFEKTGVIHQMLDWRDSHRALRENHRERVVAKTYSPYR
ncbi:MAG: lipid-A-disaccharide synthase N-terminal domain-containing protein [Planctomycetota bacterium]|jgi:lipid-A-disaccharide synthase-like uncharacterized protein|nr:lipid-A-disaccharide synthase N-terminal domain-containing protein [Planctomycetota bacterium]